MRDGVSVGCLLSTHFREDGGSAVHYARLVVVFDSVAQFEKFTERMAQHTTMTVNARDLHRKRAARDGAQEGR